MNPFFLDEKGDTTLRFALGLAWAWHDYTDLIQRMALHVRPECTMKRVIPRMLEQLQKRPGERLFIVDEWELVDPRSWNWMIRAVEPSIMRQWHEKTWPEYVEREMGYKPKYYHPSHFKDRRAKYERWHSRAVAQPLQKNDKPRLKPRFQPY